MVGVGMRDDEKVALSSGKGDGGAVALSRGDEMDSDLTGATRAEEPIPERVVAQE